MIHDTVTQLDTARHGMAQHRIVYMNYNACMDRERERIHNMHAFTQSIY